LADYRPKAAVSASAGYQYTDGEAIALGFGGELHGTQPPHSAGLTVTQTHPNEE
jgi:outer membrane protein